MFLTNDKQLYEKAKVLRSWGRMSTLIKDSENINKRLKLNWEGLIMTENLFFQKLDIILSLQKLVPHLA